MNNEKQDSPQMNVRPRRPVRRQVSDWEVPAKHESSDWMETGWYVFLFLCCAVLIGAGFALGWWVK